MSRRKRKVSSLGRPGLAGRSEMRRGAGRRATATPPCALLPGDSCFAQWCRDERLGHSCLASVRDSARISSWRSLVPAHGDADLCRGFRCAAAAATIVVMKALSVALVSGAIAVVGACTPVEPGGDPSATPQVEPDAPGQVASDDGVIDDGAKVITTLQTRDHEVTVYATASGPRFTVAAAGGTVLAERLSAQDFQGSFPGLHDRFRSAFAEDGAQLDASATLPIVESDIRR